LSVCLLYTFVSRAKTTELIEMPFGGRLTWEQGSMPYIVIYMLKHNMVHKSIDIYTSATPLE